MAFEKKLAEARTEARQDTRYLAEAQAKRKRKQRRRQTYFNASRQAEARIREARDAAMKELGDVATQGAIDAAATLAGIKITKTDAKKAVRRRQGDADGRGAKLMDAGNAPLINEGIWVAISFVFFVALVWKGWCCAGSNV